MMLLLGGVGNYLHVQISVNPRPKSFEVCRVSTHSTNGLLFNEIFIQVRHQFFNFSVTVMASLSVYSVSEPLGLTLGSQ